MSHKQCENLDDSDAMATIISIHAPRERCDPMITKTHMRGAFQSTHRVSDATTGSGSGTASGLFQSTHRVSDATVRCFMSQFCQSISIHAPRERCDGNHPFVALATCPISIHAPRERCDRAETLQGRCCHYFNPRTA